MDIVVLLKQVPDLVEELEVDESGKGLDRSGLKFFLNEFDDHALEQALLLKEAHGGQVKALALDSGDVDESLFTALAKGADSVAKVTGDFEGGVDSHKAARIFEGILKEAAYDLILTGVQAIDDLDGHVGAMVSSYLGLPYVGVISGVRLDEGARAATVRKEYPGGVLSEIRVQLPAVFGIQAAARPPRYVPIARIRQTMRTAKIEEVPAPESGPCSSPPGLRIRRMLKPEVGQGAEIISGSAEEVVSRIVGILSEKGLVR